jgi:DNA-directed RNA polymerase specialized sigma24 family protein
MLSKEDVVRALRTPYKKPLELAFEYVNLTRTERRCIDAVYIDGLTEEAAAEEMDVSRDYVAKHKKRALQKLAQAWDGLEIYKIISDYK